MLFFGHGLDCVPMFHNFSFIIKAEDVHHRFALVLWRCAAEYVQHHQIALGYHTLDFGAALRCGFSFRNGANASAKACPPSATVGLCCRYSLPIYRSVASCTLCWLNVIS